MSIPFRRPLRKSQRAPSQKRLPHEQPSYASLGIAFLPPPFLTSFSSFFHTAQDIKVTKEMNVYSSRFKARDHTRRKITGIDISKDGKQVRAVFFIMLIIPVLTSCWHRSVHQMLVSSNDSAARLYRTKDYSLICKYSGYCSKEFQVKATLRYFILLVFHPRLHHLPSSNPHVTLS